MNQQAQKAYDELDLRAIAGIKDALRRQYEVYVEERKAADPTCIIQDHADEQNLEAWARTLYDNHLNNQGGHDPVTEDEMRDFFAHHAGDHYEVSH